MAIGQGETGLLNPRELARNGAGWSGSVPVESFERLGEAVSAASGFVDIDLQFDLDDQDQCRVTGTAAFDAMVACHRCLEDVAFRVEARLDVRVLESDEQAQRLAAGFDVIVVDDPKVAVQTVVEDDLIMSVPAVVCERGLECPNAPGRRYPPEAEKTPSSPFAALEDLKNRFKR